MPPVQQPEQQPGQQQDIGTPDNPLRVAIIGSGPSGFYAAEALQKQQAKDGLNVTIDMYDRLPTPFGLVRGGVAPDHQKIKSVTKVYDRIASKPGFRFFGNVEFGKDVTREDLADLYHAIIYATGAQGDRDLNVPGEDLPGSHSATEFVAWYNGHPDFRDLQFDLSVEAAAVIGVGNVAMDVARILARTRDELLETDIADHALEALTNSNVSTIYIIGRRGPVQAKFTNPEIKELGEMIGADIVIEPDQIELDPLSREYLVSSSDRTAEQNYQTMKMYSENGFNNGHEAKPKQVVLRFLESPVELIGTDRVEAIKLVRNALYKTDRGDLRPRATEDYVTLPVGLVFRSVGYEGHPLPGVPFYEKWHTIPNAQGRVLTGHESGQTVTGDYVVGWIKRGPSGVIGTNRPDSVETVQNLLEDAQAGQVLKPGTPAPEAVVNLLQARGINYVTYDDWLILDEIETKRGAQRGRPRHKFTRVEDMLQAIARVKECHSTAIDVGTEVMPLRVAIIGSGPSGFYAAEALQKKQDKEGLVVEIDMFDRLPTPFGLVRGGVAPDHPKIKNVTKVYDRIASKENFRFFGHVEFGKDIMRADLEQHYHAIIYATGAQSDRSLGIPGEDLPGSFSATEFVAWYNAHPDFRDCVFDLSVEAVAVIGVGNVAMDVARILASSQAELKRTDIADYALEALAESQVKTIYVIGRRGPVQAKFTNPEIKELGELEEADVIIDPEEFELDRLSQEYLRNSNDRTAEQNYQTMRLYMEEGATGKPKQVVMRFLESPVEIIGEARVEAIKVVHNELYKPERGDLRPRATDKYTTLPVGLVFRSVGYRGVPLPDVPFYDKWGIIPNNGGSVLTAHETGEPVTGHYVVGWIKRGPSGVIGTNRPDSVETVSRLLEDVQQCRVLSPAEASGAAVEALLEERGVQYVTYAGWQRIDAVERARGEEQGRPRVKFSRIDDMLAVLDAEDVAAPAPGDD